MKEGRTQGPISWRGARLVYKNSRLSGGRPTRRTEAKATSVLWPTVLHSTVGRVTPFQQNGKLDGTVGEACKVSALSGAKSGKT